MIEVEHLSRYYGRRRAVEDVSFSIAANEVVGFLGLNGAGKTTTLKVLAGLLVPSSGTVRIDGVDMARAPVNFRKRIGFLPEEPPLYPEMTVREYLRFLGALRGMTPRELEDRLREVVSKCKLDGYEDHVLGELSQGYRKRVGIAQAILHQPQLVILDEPISGLDPRQIVGMRALVRSLADECTVLVSSHILHEIAQTCDRILVLHEGRLRAQGTEKELARRMQASHSVRLTVTASLHAAEAFLKAHPVVGAYEVLAHDADRVDLRVDLKQDAREELVAGLVGAGIGLRRLEDAQDELEEIFIDLTREGAA